MMLSATSKVNGNRPPSRGVAVLASIANYRFVDPNPLGHASVLAVGPALRALGFDVKECRDDAFSRPNRCQQLAQSLPDRTAPLLLFLSARGLVADRTLHFLHPHTRRHRRCTYVALPRLVAEIRRAWSGPLLLLAVLSLEDDAQLSEGQQVCMEGSEDVDAGIVCIGPGGRRYGKSGLPVIVNYVSDLLVHGPRILPELDSARLIRMIEGGGQVFADIAAVVSSISTAPHPLLWRGSGASHLPPDVVRDLDSPEQGVMQDAIQDLADSCNSAAAYERTDAAHRLLTIAASGDRGTVRLIRTVMQEGSERPAVRARRSDGRSWDPQRAPFIDLVSVSEGPFLMGTDAGTQAAARPQHTVQLPAFRISADPITRRHFLTFIQVTGYPFPAALDLWSGAREDLDLPADYISYCDARAFCEWLTQCHRARGSVGEHERYVLPTEAQWEKAARGVDGRTYPWGSEFASWRCNSRARQLGRLTPIGAHARGGNSPYGARDMAGNVCEWTSSLWGVGHREPQFGYPYSAGDGREAETIAANMRLVVRGGAYYYRPECVSCTTRNCKLPGARQVGTGFRIAMHGA